MMLTIFPSSSSGAKVLGLSAFNQHIDKSPATALIQNRSDDHHPAIHRLYFDQRRVTL
ncbi:hypothetical protein ACT691_05340 [Vibrio metschnikovii]